MDWLEQELQRALAPKQPAPGFSARVTAAVRRSRLAPARRWIAIAASLFVLSGAGAAYRWHQGVAAKDQVMLAVRLAAHKLNHVQARVLEISQ